MNTAAPLVSSGGAALLEGVMLDVLIAALVLSTLPACFAISAAHRAGAKGWSGYAVWTAEALAARLIEWAKWRRDLEQWKAQRKAEAR